MELVVIPANNSPEPSRLDALAQRAKLVLAWERIWPGLVAMLMLAALFLTLSWLGLWLHLPRWGKILGLAGFAVALVAVVAQMWRLPKATLAQALSRLDRDSGRKHRPASALTDTLANAGHDPATLALWTLHQQRLQKTAASLKLALPSPRMVDRDRFALRALALLAVAAAAIVAGPERPLRLLAAFDWRGGSVLADGFRLDAWIDPPAYTGRAPILLDARDVSAPQQAKKIAAPENSTLVVRAPAASGFTIETEGALAPVLPAAAPEKPPTASDGEQRYTLKGDARLILRRGGALVAAFDLHAIADLPPVIAITDPPQPNVRGTLTLSYKISDDYGVISAEASFTRPSLRGKQVAGRTLAEPPRIGLTLPNAQGSLGESQTVADLSDHPWAGARVSMVLSARDEGGNIGTSAPQEVTLPQRPFAKPVARALAEQRRNLVLAPDDRARVGTALAAMMIAPERFATEAGVYLGLRAGAQRLQNAKTDADLVGVADLLWEMALRIEDGDLSQAERDLRVAQNKLREAMQRGAPDAEIDRLMADVRAALDKFMKELADKQQRDDSKEQQQAGNERQGKMLTPQDFKAMMDRIEDMARSGNLAEAQKMLDQMQKMLENLQTAKRKPQDQAQREMSKALNELDAMTREEQSLRDDTFKQEQKARRQQRAQKNGQKQQQGEKGSQPQDQGEPGDEAEADANDTGDAQSAEQSQQALKDRQEALRKRLEDLQKRMKQFGQKGNDGLGQAEEAMKDAESALGNGESGQGKAVGAQGKALEGLRKGAQQLAEAMQKGEGEGSEQADDDGQDNPGEGQKQGQKQGRNKGDPLGREQGSQGQENRAGNLTGVPAAQRAQRVLEELRKRLGDTARPREETDYLERLLKRY